jgi:hypothetical protein
MATSIPGESWRMPDGSVHSKWQDQAGWVERCDTQRYGNAIATTCH